MFHCYRAIDLFPGKYGVQPIIHGYLNRFKPWYFDGSSVWWGATYELRSEAEKASEELKNFISLKV